MNVGSIRRGILGIRASLFDTCPTIAAEATQIGTTVEGRTIDVYTIGSGEHHVLFFAGIHGNEVGTVKLVSHVINWFRGQTELQKHITLHAIPSVNRDGYMQAVAHPGYFSGGRVGRFNSHNVDLNRNFDAPSFKSESVWSHGKNYQEETIVNCGEKPFSEPESKALSDYIKHRHFDLVIAFHNAGRDVQAAHNEQSAQFAKIFSESTGYRNIPESEWARMHQTGTAKEWVETQNISYIEIEGTTRWGSDWSNQKPGIEAVLKSVSAE